MQKKIKNNNYLKNDLFIILGVNKTYNYNGEPVKTIN